MMRFCYRDTKENVIKKITLFINIEKYVNWFARIAYLPVLLVFPVNAINFELCFTFIFEVKERHIARI